MPSDAPTPVDPGRPGAPEPSPAPVGLIARLKAARETETGRTAELAAASMLNNAIQLLFTVLLTRLLGKTGYASLAALVAAFLILQVSGQAMQAAAARAIVRWTQRGHHEPYREVWGWTRQALLLSILALVLGCVFRQPLADLIGVGQHPWAAAVLPVSGTLFLLVCLQRGALQGLGDFDAVGGSIVMEAVLRLGAAIVLVAIGMEVTGAFAAAPIAFAVLALGMDRRLRAKHVNDEVVSDGEQPIPLWQLARWERTVIVSLLLVAIMQNVDTILAKRELDESVAGSYAAAAVAAKAVVWVAVGVALQLLPEATRRAVAGEDPHPVLKRAIAFLFLIGVPAILIFVAIPKFLLETAFGPEFGSASGALPLLGIAMLLLSITLMSVQYLSAIGRHRHLVPLLVLAVLEVGFLARHGWSATEFATIVLVSQAVAAAVTLALAWWTSPADGVRAATEAELEELLPPTTPARGATADTPAVG
ncbi:lipopolysaccharide biosynthesis protein [Patulibacter minatonensis]|uniref:lipopolysaccharide biosynthesis protein n=1 Tax=Patulibacter minatonensis TaxID=298163 RepID=UPI0012FAD858|nr:oligosaccharide flippase family protein [Patulibacter minatonensis]